MLGQQLSPVESRPVDKTSRLLPLRTAWCWPAKPVTLLPLLKASDEPGGVLYDNCQL
jgi:hypothetical protein